MFIKHMFRAKREWQMRRKILQPVFISLALLAAITVSGCKKSSDSNPARANSNSPTAATPAKSQSDFERDLSYVRTGQFTYVFIFSRKDGAAFIKEDIDYLKANSPQETNQWIRTDDGRRVIAGTNFEFKPEHFDALNKRFNIEDYSGK